MLKWLLPVVAADEVDEICCFELKCGHVSNDQVSSPQLEPLRMNRIRAAHENHLTARSERRVRERNQQQ